jgi:virulence-associated protein E
MADQEKPAAGGRGGLSDGVQFSSEHQQFSPGEKSAQAPDRDAIGAFIRHLFGTAHPPNLGLVEVAWTGPGRQRDLNRAKLFDAEDVQGIVAEIVRRNSVPGQNAYVSASPRRRDTTRDKRASRADVIAVSAAWADLDDEGVAESARQHLKAVGLPPTLVVQTGAHPHLRAQCWFLLDESTTDLDRAEAINRRLAQLLNGDRSAVDASRLMRAAGTVAWPKKSGRIIEPTEIMEDWPTHDGAYALSEIEERLDAALEAATDPQNADPLASGEHGRRLTQQQRIERSRIPGEWHCNVRDYVAHMVQGGATSETILSLAPQFQQAGYSLDETEKEMRVMAEGAFAKFAPVVVNPPAIGEPPRFIGDENGRIKAAIENVVAAVGHPPSCGFEIRFDTFRGEVMIRPQGREGWRPIGDADHVMLRMCLPRIGFSPVGKETMRDAITMVASYREFDTAIQWLKNLPEWDGVERVATFLPRYFWAADTSYARAVSLYLWTAMAARILDPGCKIDMVPVLVGAQGCGKSSGVMALVPDPMLFAEIALNDRDADLSRKIRGKLVIELGELRGLKTRDAESIKSFITSQHERWTPKYKEYETNYPRRCIFIGTTNDDEFLGDPTGERRWLPVRVVGKVDVTAIKADRDQLWAEAQALFAVEGVAWRDAEELARPEFAAFKEHDPWEDSIHQWLHTEDLGGSKPIDRKPLRTSDIMRGAASPNWSGPPERRDALRVGRIMRSWGFTQKDRWVDGRSVKTWIKRP